MTVIEALRQYFLQAPCLTGQRLNIDCLASDPGSFSIDSVQTERVVSRYMDGSTVRRQLLAISSRAYFGEDLAQQRENIELFEQLESWLDQQDTFYRLPDLGEKRHARTLAVTSSPYPVEVDDGDQGSTARYQIQLELIYIQEV